MGRMKVKKMASLSLLAVCGVLLISLFQNCSVNQFNQQGSRASSVSESGGQGYDGKLYVEYGSCPDGTSVVSRVMMKSATSAQLLRENCATIPARDLDPSEFAIDPLDLNRIFFQAREFLHEVLPVTKKALPLGYYQWTNSPRAISTPLIYMIDVNVSTNDLLTLRQAGHTVICMITAGVTNNRDVDFASYNSADIGQPQTGRPGDYWLDTRSANVRTIMGRKLARAHSKGCGGVLWDQTDAHLSATGFPLSAATGVDFAKFLALSAHDRKMPVVLANTGDLSASVVNFYDMQYSENCNQKGTCDRYKAFADQGKPVLISDTGSFSAALCSANRSRQFSLWFTSVGADGSRYEPCP